MNFDFYSHQRGVKYATHRCDLSVSAICYVIMKYGTLNSPYTCIAYDMILLCILDVGEVDAVQVAFQLKIKLIYNESMLYL